MNRPLISAQGLQKYYVTSQGFLGSAWGRKTLVALSQVNLDLYRGETLGLVGESGCGKSTLGMCLAGLRPVSEGKMMLDGAEYTSSSHFQKKLRSSVQVVFQDPYSSLNPRMQVQDIVGDALRIQGVAEADIKARVATALDDVGLTSSDLKRYPHQFSGGQRQRIGIARALVTKPKILICDEPVSALDVSVQAQILNLLRQLKETYQLTMLFISHDLSVVRYMSDRIAVMYKGQIVECQTRDALFAAPLNEYTKVLLKAIPPRDFI